MVEFKTKAEIIEIFSSIQGEGIYVGQSQIFIRFARCNLNCSYCDTSAPTGVRELSSRQALREISRLSRIRQSSGNKKILVSHVPTGFNKQAGNFEVVSLTGGEPLVQAGFLEEFLPALKKAGYKTYLETNGTLVRSLARVIKWIDIIAMDLKLPSSTGQKGRWAKHSQFLQTIFALNKKTEVFVKVVVGSQTTEKDLKKAVSLVKKKESEIRSKIKPEVVIPFIIQPVCWGTGKKMKIKISLKKLLKLESLAGSFLTDVRVIPQTHKILGLR